MSSFEGPCSVGDRLVLLLFFIFLLFFKDLFFKDLFFKDLFFYYIFECPPSFVSFGFFFQLFKTPLFHIHNINSWFMI